MELRPPCRRPTPKLLLQQVYCKFVNDSLGHTSGDLLIQEVSRRLLGTLRKQDIVARIGGDEFGIILPEADEPDDLVEMGQRILAAMTEAFRIAGEEIFVTVSVGIAIGPAHGRDAEELMRNADTAMFHAKDQGRNNMQLYTDKLNTRAVERLKIENNPRRVSVNLSFKQFRKPDFLNSVKRAIQDSGVDPNRLELELTKSMVMHDVDSVIQVLKRIKALGIEISIDDFGTGYSSLSHIRRLPIDTIKIDRSFVKEVTTSAGDAEIATAIVALAHSLNLKVIAEGVETTEQLSFLSSRRCDSFQGFLASPAVPAEKFQAFQADWHDRNARTSA